MEFLISTVDELRNNGKVKLILQKIEESETLFHQKISQQPENDKLKGLLPKKPADHLVPSETLEQRMSAQKKENKNLIGSKLNYPDLNNQTPNFTRGRRKSTQLINNLTRQKISGDTMTLAKLVPKIKYTLSLIIYLIHYLKVIRNMISIQNFYRKKILIRKIISSYFYLL